MSLVANPRSDDDDDDDESEDSDEARERRIEEARVRP
jgi:hypothetical protein